MKSSSFRAVLFVLTCSLFLSRTSEPQVLPDADSVDLTLKSKVHLREKSRLYRGSPVIFSARVVNVQEIRRFNADNRAFEQGPKVTVPLGTEEKGWHSNLSFRLYRTSGIGEREIQDPGIRLLDNLGESEEALLVGMRALRKRFVIPPEITSRLPNGRYRIDIALETSSKRVLGLYPVELSSSVSFSLHRVNSRRGRSEVQRQLATYHGFQQNLGERLKANEKALELNPRNKGLNLALAYDHYRLKDYAKAKKHFEEALDYYESLPERRTEPPPGPTIQMIKWHIDHCNQRLGNVR